MSSCEIFRFYKLITAKSLIEPVSMIVPRRVSVVVTSAREAGNPSWRRQTPEPRVWSPCPWASNRKADGHVFQAEESLSHGQYSLVES